MKDSCRSKEPVNPSNENIVDPRVYVYVVQNQSEENEPKKSKNEEYVLVNEFNPNFDGDQNNSQNSPIKLGGKQYGCPFCPKILPYSSRMKQHILIHTKEKPFKCDTCGKGFRQKGGLNQHLMIHTGEKKFWCNFCGKGFIQKQNFQFHLANSHQQTP